MPNVILINAYYLQHCDTVSCIKKDSTGGGWLLSLRIPQSRRSMKHANNQEGLSWRLAFSRQVINPRWGRWAGEGWIMTTHIEKSFKRFQEANGIWSGLERWVGFQQMEKVGQSIVFNLRRFLSAFYSVPGKEHPNSVFYKIIEVMLSTINLNLSLSEMHWWVVETLSCCLDCALQPVSSLCHLTFMVGSFVTATMVTM